MKLTITTLTGELYMLDVSPDVELENLKALSEYESGIPAKEIVVMHEGRPLLDDKKNLKTYGIKDGDVLLIQHFVPQQGTGSSSSGTEMSMGPLTGSHGEDDPAFLRDMILKNPEQLALLKHNNPQLGDALLSGNLDTFTKVLYQQQKEKADRDRLRICMMNADPFDPETQRLIAEEIRQQNIDSNMEAAMEYHPESFGQVIMLYINCRVNGHPVKAFIDSGAQTTIMSQACAERCAIIRLVDPRWAGIAKGVGTQKIIGRIHLVQIEIGGVFLTSSFSVLEEQPMDMLLGLDMLKRHQCLIDLKRNVLVIGTTGTETPFLGEGELPDCARQPPLTTPSTTTLQEQEDRALAQALVKSREEAGPSSGSLQPVDNFSMADVQYLESLGFPRHDCIVELRKFNGDRNRAMAALFAKSLKVPG
ncbi:protein DDI1 homolog 2-like isoform X2 [Ornithodoros turicata]|uniref:protein DDI1 homolog 2-like isoform X2 n=1 Tax=Ornithodoros turicata TaxID=34597 RepID=UPI0031386DA6